jgi:cytosine/adenosine deaminase-related metal-dependent hydrolase
MIIRAPVIVTMNGAPIENGAVRIAGDRIAQVGAAAGFRTSDDRVINLDGCVLLPGLINAHCHLDYTGLRETIPPQKSFTAWIRAINAEKARLTAADYLQSIADGCRESLRFGTTSMVNLEAFPKLIVRFPTQQLRVWWCAELIDVTEPEKTEEMVAAAMNFLHRIDSSGGFGLAPHALYTASAELYRQCEQIASAENLLLCTHLAESREEMEMFRHAAGPLFEFLRGLGRNMSDCDGTTPLQVFLQRQAKCDAKAFSSNAISSGTDPRWLVAHLNELAESDFELLARLEAKFSIAHCPRSHDYFQHSPFAFERLQNLGFNICLATDSLASNTDLSLFAEMREFQAHREIRAAELLQMVTLNPAKALGRAADLGKIAPGYLADLIALPISDSAVYEQIVAFNDDIRWTMIDGKVL